MAHVHAVEQEHGEVEIGERGGPPGVEVCLRLGHEPPTHRTLARAPGANVRAQRLQASAILARRHAHEHLLNDAPGQRVVPGERPERGQRDLLAVVPTAPGAGHEEPVFPWSRADFRNHVLRLVRKNVPEIMEDLHTIADLSDPDQIRRDIDAGATRWQLDKPWITRTMHRTVRVWPRAPTMRASRQWRWRSTPAVRWERWDSRAVS